MRARNLLHRVEWSWWRTRLYDVKEEWSHKMIVFAPWARWATGNRRDRLIALGFVLVMALGLGTVTLVCTHGVGGIAWLFLRA